MSDQRAADVRAILAGMEPALSRLHTDILDVKADVVKLREGMAEIKGQLRYMPNIRQIVGTMLAINAGILGLGTWAARFFH
jgi:hypothetical protein